jgi:hypothetical protein
VESFVLSGILLGLILAMIAYMGVRILWTITRNMRQGEKYRQELAIRLSDTCLPGLLRSFGIEPVRYLHSLPIPEIEKHLRACAACTQLPRCKEAATRNLSPEEYAFCPNHQDLLALRQRLYPQ